MYNKQNYNNKFFSNILESVKKKSQFEVIQSSIQYISRYFHLHFDSEQEIITNCKVMFLNKALNYHCPSVKNIYMTNNIYTLCSF